MQMNSKLSESDPDLYTKIVDDFDRNEIRSSERIIIEDWVAKALIAETLLSLLRKDLIDITGLAVINDGQDFEPTFAQSAFLKTGSEEMQKESPST